MNSWQLQLSQPSYGAGLIGPPEPVPVDQLWTPPSGADLDKLATESLRYASQQFARRERAQAIGDALLRYWPLALLGAVVVLSR